MRQKGGTAMKHKFLRLSFLYIFSLLFASCTPVSTPVPFIPVTQTLSPTSTLTLTPTNTRTPKPTLTPDPLAKYEGDCRFCFIDGSDPSMPVWNNGSQGYVPQQNDQREQIILDENFRVLAGQENTFENKIIWVRPKGTGEISIYGTLIIKDSLVLWDQTRFVQTELRVENGGILNIENSYVFSTNQFWVYWSFLDGSTIYLDHLIGQSNISIHGSVNYTATNYSTVHLSIFEDVHDTIVDVQDAHNVTLQIIPPTGEHQISFPPKGQWSNWEFSDMWPNTIVRIDHSYIYERDFSINNNTHITVHDVMDGFNIGWPIHKDNPGFITCEIRDLGDPKIDQGVYYEDMTWSLPCNNSSLRIINSVLQKAWPNAWGYVNLKVYDSNLATYTNWGSPTTIEIYDSTIDYVFAYGGGKVYIENSKIRYSIEVSGSGSQVHGYNIVKRDPTMYQIYELDGGKYLDVESPGPSW